MFTPENDLERSLVKAATDPSHRPQFYRDLLASDIFVISSGDAAMDIRDGVLKQGATVAIQRWRRDGQDWLPIFSSLPRLRQNLAAEANYLRLNARNFFEMTRGTHVILNPNCEYGKEFLAEEIAGLLDGSIYAPTKTTTTQKDTRVLLGQPKVYPTELVKALSTLFAQHRNVKAAYLAHFFNPDSGEPPHTLIGIDADGESQVLFGEAGMVARDVLPRGELVDFTQVKPHEEGLSQYLIRETKPFYRRSL
jgi:type III secretion system (T3SS) SseB-like protein